MNTRPGKITTFYSFKGGVGRTMALANVAFLAAANGMRVLVMDWDLEAPGLAYYFRGLLGPGQSRALKQSPGLMNLFWQWNSAVKHMPVDRLQAELDRFKAGEPFQDCVHPLINPDQRVLPKGAALDYIGPGSPTIHVRHDVDETITYEEALATFSWEDFFDQQAGGVVLESLRRWSKKRYDLILIDSRTGLADVAGTCTMQMPDEVMLCFIFNRQNIDGVAKIARTIRSKRGSDIKLRAIPMRTARVGTLEESDARAKAIWELTRVGEFSGDQLDRDFSLAIHASEGVPFFETLAPLLPQTPAFEVFSTHYRQLASDITGKALKIPELPQEIRELAKRRLEPRHATTEYIQELHSAEPARAAEEIERLLISAYEEQMDGEALDADYILALTEAAFSVDELIDLEPEDENLAERALELLHVLYAEDNEGWASPLLEALERYWVSASYRLPFEQQLSILDEIDSLLAESRSVAGKLRRISYRLQSAYVYSAENDGAAAMITIVECRGLIESLRAEHAQLAPDQMESLVLSEVELYRLEGDIKSNREETATAIKSYESGVKLLSKLPDDALKGALARALFMLHQRLSHQYHSVLHDKSAAVKHALLAANIAVGTRTVLGAYFSSLAEPVIASQNPGHALEFCASALLQDAARASGMIPSVASRTPKLVVELIETASELAELIGRHSDTRVPDTLDALSNIAKSTLNHLSRRRSVLEPDELQDIARAADGLRDQLERAGWQDGDERPWREVLDNLPNKRKLSGTSRRGAGE
jgi:hypothetical protein